jgi:hypothetical protein
MTVALLHSPAEIIQQALVGSGLAVQPPSTGLTGLWPAWVSVMPDVPDNVLVVYDTAGKDMGRTSPDQRRSEYHGVSIHVRSMTLSLGWQKARSICDFFDTLYSLPIVFMDASYLIRNVIRTTGALSLGFDAPQSKRRLFTVNALVWLQDT